MTDNHDNLIPPLDTVPEELRALADGYVADALDADRMARLEDLLRADPSARRFFARYARLDRGLHLEAHARRQGDAALARIGIAAHAGPGDRSPGSTAGPVDGRTEATTGGPTSGDSASGDPTPGRRLRLRPLRGLAAAAAIAAAVGTGWMLARSQVP